MDWLEQFSPMKVDWKHKWLALPYNGSTVVLYGDVPSAPEGTVIQVCAVELHETEPVVSIYCHPEIQQILDEFSVLFELPTTLPPSRACDHIIPFDSWCCSSSSQTL